MSRIETIDLGPVPADEDCIQTADPDYEVKALEECNRWLLLLRASYAEAHGCMPEDHGAKLRVRGSSHDFGTYYEVVVRFDEDDHRALQAAFWLESDSPTHWPKVRPNES